VSSWAAQQAIRNIVLVAVVGGGIYGLYRFIDTQGRVEATGDDECRADRRQILETCEPMCESPGDSPMPVQVTKHGVMDPECLDKCAMKEFGKPIPVCASRR
jgi:hypothetical protein